MGENGAPFIRGLANPHLLPSWQLQNIPFGQKPQKWAPAKTHGGERKQDTKNKTKQKNPRLRGGEEQTELWTKVTPHLEDILQPAPQGGGNTIQCLAALFKEHRFPPPPPTPTHWPLVLLFGLFFFFSFFLFNTQTLHFQSLKNFYLKKKKTHLKLDEASPRPGLSTWWPALPWSCRQSPAWHHWGNRPTAGSPWTTLFKAGWALIAGGITTKGKGKHSPPFLKHPPSELNILGNV